MSALLYVLADTLPIWRSSAIAALTFFVIGCVMFVVSMYDE